jgi:hypothetical protein
VKYDYGVKSFAIEDEYYLKTPTNICEEEEKKKKDKKKEQEKEEKKRKQQ